MLKKLILKKKKTFQAFLMHHHRTAALFVLFLSKGRVKRSYQKLLTNLEEQRSRSGFGLKQKRQ